MTVAELIERLQAAAGPAPELRCVEVDLTLWSKKHSAKFEAEVEAVTIHHGHVLLKASCFDPSFEGQMLVTPAPAVNPS